MECGLNIKEDEFMRLRPKEQNLILFRNQNTTISLVKGYKDNVRKYEITNKWVMAIGGVLVVGMATLFSFHLL